MDWSLVAREVFETTSTVLGGIVFGEAAFRVCRRFEPEPKKRKSGRTRSPSKRTTKMLENFGTWTQSFYDKFDSTLLILVAVFTVIYQYEIYQGEMQFVSNFIAMALMWVLYRFLSSNPDGSSSMFLSNFDLERLRDTQPYMLGAGLALSHWCGFLSFMVAKSEDNEFLLTEAWERFSESTKKDPFMKELLVLLPESCRFPDEIVFKTTAERIKTVGVLSIPNCNRVTLKRERDFKLSVFEIFSQDKSRSFVIAFDAPNILKTSMETENSLELKRRNIADFKKNLNEYLFPPAAARVQPSPVQFLELKDSDWPQNVDAYLACLADAIINHLESSSADLNEVISSDECSD